ncbi:hypothetical protein D3C74_448090 [compost metagenome]
MTNCVKSADVPPSAVAEPKITTLRMRIVLRPHLTDKAPEIMAPNPIARNPTATTKAMPPPTETPQSLMSVGKTWLTIVTSMPSVNSTSVIIVK